MGNEVITFETPDGVETVELEDDALVYDSEKSFWKIPKEKFETDESIEYRMIPENRVYEVRMTETAPEYLL